MARTSQPFIGSNVRFPPLADTGPTSHLNPKAGIGRRFRNGTLRFDRQSHSTAFCRQRAAGGGVQGRRNADLAAACDYGRTRRTCLRARPATSWTPANGNVRSNSSRSRSTGAGAPSSWRPPWFEIITPLAPDAIARFASCGVITPLIASGPLASPRRRRRRRHNRRSGMEVGGAQAGATRPCCWRGPAVLSRPGA